jgi:hypothetical protein
VKTQEENNWDCESQRLNDERKFGRGKETKSIKHLEAPIVFDERFKPVLRPINNVQ